MFCDFNSIKLLLKTNHFPPNKSKVSAYKHQFIIPFKLIQAYNNC